MNPPRTCLSLGLLVAFAAFGCGGADDSAGQQGFKRANTGNAPPAKQVAAKPKKKNAKPSQRKSKAVADEFVNPANMFEIVEDEPNFEITARSNQVKESDLFFVRPPESGDTGASFLTSVPEEAQPGGQLNPEITMPEGFAVIDRFGYTDEGFPWRVRCVTDNSEMVLVPGGVFIMGTDDGPIQSGPQLAVLLDHYYIDVTEVTVGQYKMFIDDRKKNKKRAPAKPLNESSPEDHPALGISWGDAKSYATWVGKDLPNEAEWEKAARGARGFRNPWGNGRAIWSRQRDLGQIDPVKSFAGDRSPYGVFDLAGNAAEWCSDWYSDKAFETAASSGNATVRKWTGPKRASLEYQRVVKGMGSDWTAWNRTGMVMREHNPQIGFRCVRRAHRPAKAD